MEINPPVVLTEEPTMVPILTTGDMHKWTKRLNGILGGAPSFREVRLAQMLFDIERCYGVSLQNVRIFKRIHPQIAQLFETVQEEFGWETQERWRKQ